MLQEPFYNPTKSYEENFDHGPWGALADGKPVVETGEPQHTFFGQPVYTPFGIPAGPLPNSKFLAAAFQKGFDVSTYKTVRSQKYPAHSAPNVLAVKVDGDLTPDRAKQPLVADNTYVEPLSITNSFGVPSMDPDFWQSDMQKSIESARKGQVLVGSFQGTNTGGDAEAFIADYALAAKMVKETGAKVLEANLSCPNEGTANLVCYDIERVRQISERIKNQIGNTPLILKVGYFASDEELEKLVKAVGNIVEGLAAINTIPAQIVDKNGEQALPGEGRLVSGVCGASIKWAGLDMVKRLKAIQQKLGTNLEIIGVGGVMHAQDYHEYINAGANAVQSATGSMWNPNLATEIKASLK